MKLRARKRFLTLPPEVQREIERLRDEWHAKKRTHATSRSEELELRQFEMREANSRKQGVA